MRDMHWFWNAGGARSVEYNKCLILDLLKSPLKWVGIDTFDGAIVEKELQVGHGNSLHRLPLGQYFRKYRKWLFWLKNGVATDFFQNRKVSLQAVPMGAENGLHRTHCELSWLASKLGVSTDYMACLCCCKQNNQVTDVDGSDEEDRS